jgi:hypothetical protein
MDNIKIGMLWQDTSSKTENEFFKKATEYFKNKLGYYPHEICVNEKVQIKEYEGIPLVKDDKMYSPNLILMMIGENK